MPPKKGGRHAAGPAVARPPTATASSAASPPPPVDPQFPPLLVTNKFVRCIHHRVQLGLHQICLIDRRVVGIDDPVYGKNKTIWEAVPRGQARVFFESSSGSWTQQCSLVGNRKFGYRDDRGYGEPMSSVNSIVAIEKENGECAHIAAFEFKGDKFWVIGSKHVHLTFRDGRDAEKDLLEYEDIDRFRFALRIAGLFLSVLGKAFPNPARRLEFHAAMSRARWTACAEAIFSDSQHIVDYQGKNDLRFFALCHDVPSAPPHGLCVAPETAYQFFSEFGVPAAPRSERMRFPSEEADRYFLDVARRINSEGVVVYGSSAPAEESPASAAAAAPTTAQGPPPTGCVVKLWKEKSYPYVMERVAREAIVRRKMLGPALAAYLHKRLDQQPADLRLYFADWEKERLPFLLRFAGWLALHAAQMMTAVKTSSIGTKQEAEQWAVQSRWLDLQHTCRQVDDASLDVILDEALRAKRTNALPGDHHPMLSVMFSGPMGSGKSTLSRVLHHLLQQAGQSPRWINQDEVGVITNCNLAF